MKPSNYTELETLFLALGDKTRLGLLARLADGPVSVGELADDLGLSQPLVSRHLAYLRNAGVVTTRRDGKWIYYEIAYSDDASRAYLLATVIRALSDVDEDVVETGVQRMASTAPKRPSDKTEDSFSQTTDEELDVFLL